MKKLNKLILVIVFLFVFTVNVYAEAKSSDFEVTQIATTLNEVEKFEKEQQAQAEVVDKNLKMCSYLDYTTSITPMKQTFDTITKETASEKDEVIEEKAKEGYFVTVEVKEHEEQRKDYAFNVLNGVVLSATVNNNEDNSYNNKSIDEVLDEFEDIDNEDVRVVNEINSIEESIDETEIKISEEAAKTLVESLIKQGYTASYNQNNNTINQIVISSKEQLTNDEIALRLKAANANKEIKDVSVTTVSTPGSYESEKYDDSTMAENKYNELLATGKYETINIVPSIDTTRTNKIQEKVAFEWTKDSLEAYSEDVYTKEVKTGYKYFYNVEETIQEAQNLNQTDLTYAQCQELYNSHSSSDGWTSDCSKVTNTTITESDNNKINFNDTPQSTRTWSHLDISVGQNINIVDTNGNVIASNIEGSLSNIEVTLNGTTKIEYDDPTYDSGRLEVRQSTKKGNYTKVTNEDKVSISATLTYKYNGQTYTKNVILEGYLNNDFNVCRQKGQKGGGFDLELNLNVTEDGKLVVSVTTEESWTFTATKPAQTKIQGYYDEYEYIKQYQVVANDEDYVYNVSYVATDYNVSYKGTKANYNIIEKTYDKYYLINGEKTLYEVKTVGVIKEADDCEINGYGQLIVNYVTIDGKILFRQLQYKGIGGNPYETIEKSFDGYQLVKVEGNETGKYVKDETIVVTYIYRPIPSVNTGITENNFYEVMLLMSAMAFVSIIVFRKRISE